MRYQALGNSGLLVSQVGLGCNNFGGRIDVQQSRSVVDAAIDAGITLFDTADIYGKNGGSEVALGEILQGRRDKVVLATKFGGKGRHGIRSRGWREGRRGYIRLAPRSPCAGCAPTTSTCTSSTRRTGDPDRGDDRRLDDLVAEGKVRYLGHSNLSGWQIADAANKALQAGRAPFISAQNHWSLLERGVEAEVVPAARHFGLGVPAVLPARQRDADREGPQGPGAAGGQPDRRALQPDHAGQAGEGGGADRLGAERGVSLLEIAIGGLAAQPGCSSVIAGATTAEQVKANAAAGSGPVRG